MKICRFDDDRTGVVRGDRVFDVTERVGRGALSIPDDFDVAKGKSIALKDVHFLSPVKAPGKIVAAPVNYRAHVEEMRKSKLSPGASLDIDKAGLFLKAVSSLVGPSQGIAQRFLERRTDFELELVAVVGRKTSGIRKENALEYIAGYCLGLDITVRGSEDRGFRKSIDSYTVLGPWLTTADEVGDPQKLTLTLKQNGELRQTARTAEMVWDVARIIEYAASFHTLHPGDVVFTGTPEGVGPIRPGDRLLASSDLLGAMEVAVREYNPADAARIQKE